MTVGNFRGLHNLATVLKEIKSFVGIGVDFIRLNDRVLNASLKGNTWLW